jgi:hypothetical protein
MRINEPARLPKRGARVFLVGWVAAVNRAFELCAGNEAVMWPCVWRASEAALEICHSILRVQILVTDVVA